MTTSQQLRVSSAILLHTFCTKPNLERLEQEVGLPRKGVKTMKPSERKRWASAKHGKHDRNSYPKEPYNGQLCANAQKIRLGVIEMAYFRKEVEDDFFMEIRP